MRGRAIDEDEDKAMDEVELEGEATDEDEDVIPGCYPFSVGIEGITVWIRADYIRIFEIITKRLRNRAVEHHLLWSLDNRVLVSLATSLPLCSAQNRASRKKVFGSIMPPC
jgi:hypothetical protein